MPVPSSITSLSQTAGSNSPAGSESPALIDDYLRALSAFIAYLRDDKASTSGSYSDPAWIASLSGAKLTAASVAATALAGNIPSTKLATGAAAANIGYTPANDAGVVHTTGNETIAGNKVFSGATQLATITDGTNSTSATNAIQGSAKAWVNFNGVTTASVRASYNISSVVRNALGSYTVNLVTALADANYSITTSSSYNNTVASPGNNSNPSSHPISSSSCAVFCSDGSLSDMQTISIAIFR